jgi:hypothetical protein
MVMLPVWLLLSVPVIVALPTPPTIVAMLPEGWLMTDGLFELNDVELVTSVPFKVALKVMVVLPPKVARLMGDEGLDVILSVCCVCPTVTVSVPLIVPLVAVMVTPVVLVLAIPFTSPVELTVTWVASELVQVAELVKFFVLPSSLLPVAVNCRVPPTCRFGLAGVTVMLVSVGLTKNPRQPTQARLTRQRKALSNNHFRFGLNIA